MAIVSFSPKAVAAPVLYATLAEAGVFPESRLMTLREF
jgi:transketolase N-terminal domain/subunit